MGNYWDSNGKYQELADKLRVLVPEEGAVEKPLKNKALEKFRKATNCYYDLYDNGLGNRRRQFSSLFKINTSEHILNQSRYLIKYDAEMYAKLENMMDEIIMDAAIEQDVS